MNPNIVELASVKKVESHRYREFMRNLNEFAHGLELRTFRGWSKNWEYPWVWVNTILESPWSKVLDIGSELSPIPAFMARTMGCNVTMVEREQMRGELLLRWVELRKKIHIEWAFTESELLPFADETFDLVTSFSVIEHQQDKQKAITEAIRVLRPGGTLAITFDICEPEMGMTYPAENGEALTMDSFDKLIWQRPEFGNKRAIEWNTEDIPGFLQWHVDGNPRHNYVAGGAILRKA